MMMRKQTQMKFNHVALSVKDKKEGFVTYDPATQTFELEELATIKSSI